MARNDDIYRGNISGWTVPTSFFKLIHTMTIRVMKNILLKRSLEPMQYKTHLITTFALATPTAYMTGNLDLLGACGLALGTLLPDIDEPNSFIGRRIPIIPNLFKKILGHRGMTHTLFATLLFVYLAIEFPNGFTEMLALGYLLHIIEDTFSVTGTQLFAPITSKKIAFKWYTTGKESETIVMIVMLIWLCIGYYILKF